MEKVRPTFVKSLMEALGMKGLGIALVLDSDEGREETAHPTGQDVSNPFAAAQGSPFFFTASCIFRDVISIASAASVQHTQCRDSGGGQTVSRDIILRLGFRDISTILAYHHPKLDYPHQQNILLFPLERSRGGKGTFMMTD